MRTDARSVRPLSDTIKTSGMRHLFATSFSKNNRGAALLITLLIITTLSALTLVFSEESNLELELAGNARDAQRAHEIARSGVNLALAMIYQDEVPGMDSLRENWARFGIDPFPDQLPEDIKFSGSIQDESGKININALINNKGEIDKTREAQLVRLFVKLGLEPDLLEPLLDWLDSDDVPRLHGAESNYYQGLVPPYRCPNGPLLTIGQLFLVKGMNEIRKFGNEKKRRITDYLTIYTDGKININTAPKEILECLSDKMDASIADAILEYRKENDFMKIDDLKKVSAVDNALYLLLRPWITVKSSAYTVESEGDCRGAIIKIRAVVKNQRKNPKIVYWRVH